MIGVSPFLTAYILVLAGILGAVFGSFLTCMAWRIVNHENIWKGRSHCDNCDHALGVLDLIPIFSYFFLRGKCRYCGKKFSPRSTIAEAFLAAVFVLTVLRFDISFEALRYLVLFCILLVLSLVDLDIMEIPDACIIAGIIWWAVTIPLMADGWKNELIMGLIAAFAIGGGLLLLSLVFDKLTGKESLGGGDVKLFFMLGLYLGPWLGLLDLIVSCVVGLVFALIMQAREKQFPFGPSISIASFLVILWGGAVVDWYVGLF